MAYKIILESKQEIPFKYRNVGVKGKPIISLGDYEMPEVEWIGILAHHFRQKFAQDDLRSKWVNNLHKIQLLPIGSDLEGWDWSFSFSEVMKNVQAEGSVSHLPQQSSSFLSISRSILNDGTSFRYADYEIGRQELIKATNYLFSNYYFHNQHDRRLFLLEALMPDWDKCSFWNDQTEGENAKLKKQQWTKKLADVFENQELQKIIS